MASLAFLNTKARHSIAAISTAVILTGCSANGDGMSGFGISDMDWFNSTEPTTEESFNVGRDPSKLGSGIDKEVILHNAIELAEQKRFIEARILLGNLRDIQHRQSDGYRAISTAMALLALREGDIKAFRRIARQLDTSLNQPVRVPPAYAEVVSLYRAMSQQSLPVNASEKIQQLRDRLLPVETAGLNEGASK
jgi:hypothetical protein